MDWKRTNLCTVGITAHNKKLLQLSDTLCSGLVPGPA